MNCVVVPSCLLALVSSYARLDFVSLLMPLHRLVFLLLFRVSSYRGLDCEDRASDRKYALITHVPSSDELVL